MLFQNVLPIDAFIKVAFLVFSSLVRKLGSNPKFPKIFVPETVALFTFSIDFLVALNTVA